MCVDHDIDGLQLGWKAKVCPHTYLSVAISQVLRIPATANREQLA